jgi:hypothetical protein
VSPGASLSGAFTALATAGLAAAATTPPESQASLCWSCRQRRAKPGVGGGVRGGGFGPPPPHEGQISTLPPSNLRLSQSCQALSWATPESGPNFSAFKACSRRQVVTGSASAGHTAKQNPRARRQLPENRGHWQPPQTVPGLRLGAQSHLGRESLTNLARSSRSGRRRAKARGSNKHSIAKSAPVTRPVNLIRRRRQSTSICCWIVTACPWR